MKDSIERWLGTLFGLIFLGLSILVTIETIVRKVFNFSLQGADELGGYSLAVGGTIAFSLALMGRTHIRVDVFHEHLPTTVKAVLDWLSAIALAAFAVLIAWLAWYVIQDTMAYMSVSQTPWATPLKYPQSAWLAGLIIFAAVAVLFAVRASWLLLRGQAAQLDREFGPRSTREEVDEELADLKVRSRDAGAPSASPLAESRI
ncbi:MAG: TRAP transporter small permease [Burkholderiaceae bacterium]|nr:TRAP transporter small permease [Rhodoferax sp.]MCB2004332.1 TRAP transporter small permease [Rhodoferax sp.]MCB2027815.1 TRAP transporter small permease [Rhodoferax sp.]MCB2039456.1 TRAP transporter small permease [Rhodoferax sp.]